MENWANFGLVVLFGLVGDGSLTMFAGGYFLPPEPVFLTNGTFHPRQNERKSRWWFQRFFFFTPTWGRFPF